MLGILGTWDLREQNQDPCLCGVHMLAEGDSKW